MNRYLISCCLVVTFITGTNVECALMQTDMLSQIERRLEFHRARAEELKKITSQIAGLESLKPLSKEQQDTLNQLNEKKAEIERDFRRVYNG